MDQQASPRPAFTKPVGGFVVVLAVALLIGGWLYVDMVKNELEMKIEALSDELAAARMEAEGADEPQEEAIAPAPASETAQVFSSEYGFSLTTSSSCAGEFSVKEDPKPFPKDAEAGYQVFLTDSKGWPAGSAWYSYAVISQGSYDALPDDELPGKPGILAVLNDGNLLVSYAPQDGPSDLGDCSLAVKLSR